MEWLFSFHDQSSNHEAALLASEADACTTAEGLVSAKRQHFMRSCPSRSHSLRGVLTHLNEIVAPHRDLRSPASQPLPLPYLCHTPHLPRSCDTASVHTHPSCPHSGALSHAGSSAWNTPPSNCPTAGSISTLGSQFQCHFSKRPHPSSNSKQTPITLEHMSQL